MNTAIGPRAPERERSDPPAMHDASVYGLRAGGV